MPQLKWDETEFIECLEVVPEVAEHQTRHIFTVTKDRLTLTLVIWQLESIIILALHQDGREIPITQFTLAVRGDARFHRQEGQEFLEFRDCAVCPGRFSYIHGPGDPSETSQFGYPVTVRVTVKPQIHIQFLEVER
jgi:hypothetical protein